MRLPQAPTQGLHVIAERAWTFLYRGLCMPARIKECPIPPHTTMQVFSSFMSAYDKVIFNPTTNLSHVEQINKAAMAGAVRRSNVVLAALSEGFFASTWCEAEIEAAREAGIKVIPCYSGEEYGATRSMLMRAPHAT